MTMIDSIRRYSESTKIQNVKIARTTHTMFEFQTFRKPFYRSPETLTEAQIFMKYACR